MKITHLRISIILPSVLVLLLAGCGGGGGAKQVPGAPVAVAGEDMTVQSGETVELYGWDSYDEDGTIVSYEWVQLSGTDVGLEDGGFGTATFIAPPSGESDLALEFGLLVKDDEGKQGGDVVVVTVEAQGGTPDGLGLLHDGVYSPENFVVSNGVAFFTALDENDTGINAPDREQVWITDGTFSGTRMVLDLGEGDDVSGSARILTAFKDGVVVTGYDGTHLGGLWFTDGTEAGTHLIKDITTAVSENIFFVGVGGDYFYFTANDGVHGTELWASDGTPEGTHMLVDRNPDGDSRVERAEVATYYNGAFYVYLWHYESGTFNAYPQLYRTDGTPGNLTALTNNTANGSVLLDYDMIEYNDLLYFTWKTAFDNEIWVTDGTIGGTHAVITAGSVADFNDWPSNFHILDDQLLFFAYSNSSTSGSHKALWSTNGTAGGTEVVELVDLYVGGNSQMVMMNGLYYFPGRDLDNNFYSLWVTDGTAGGTHEVHDVQPPSGGGFPKMVVLGNKLIFRGTDEVHGFEPWVSDGTAGGTFMLKDINPDMGEENGSFTTNGGVFTARGSKAYFVAGSSVTDFQLYETDGTSAGTKIIAPDDATVTVSPMSQEGFLNDIELAAPTKVGNTLVFSAGFHGGHRLYRN